MEAPYSSDFLLAAPIIPSIVNDVMSVMEVNSNRFVTKFQNCSVLLRISKLQLKSRQVFSAKDFNKGFLKKVGIDERYFECGRGLYNVHIVEC